MWTQQVLILPTKQSLLHTTGDFIIEFETTCASRMDSHGFTHQLKFNWFFRKGKLGVATWTKG